MPHDQKKTLQAILDFVTRLGYATKYKDPHYKRLVRRLAQQTRHEDDKEEYSQDIRHKAYGGFKTGGKAGFMPVVPYPFGENGEYLQVPEV